MNEYDIKDINHEGNTINFLKRTTDGRGRAQRRKLNAKKAKRKERIAKEIDGITYDSLHEYSKNKIHCSCPSCSGLSKTNSKKVNKGGAKPQIRFSGFGTTNHRKGKNYKTSEVRKIEKMEYSLIE